MSCYVILFPVLWIPFVDRQQHLVMSATKKSPASKPRCQDSEQIELPLPLALHPPKSPNVRMICLEMSRVFCWDLQSIEKNWVNLS
jgi:hypothetical protein